MMNMKLLEVLIPPSIYQYEHVTPETERVGSATLLQDHYRVPHVTVNEVDPEVGLTQDTPWKPLYGSHHLSFRPG